MRLKETYTPKPGDAVFAHTQDLYGWIIRVAQRIRWRRGHEWNHMAIVVQVDPDGTVWCLQMHRRCELTRLKDIAPGGYVKMVPCPENVDATRAVEYANTQRETHYAVLTVISIFINLFLPRFFQFDLLRAGTLMCSGLVARSWEHGGWVCGTASGQLNPFQITPGQFDLLLTDGHLLFVPPKSKEWPYQ
jgi:hypothetical protein